MGVGMVKVDLEKVGQILIVGIDGELDLKTAPVFKQKVEEKMGQHENIRHIMVDFAGVPFMDSSGLGVLLFRFKQIQQLGGKMVLVNVKPHLMKMFSGFFRIMEIYPDRAEGLKALGGIQD
ncbi:MAG: anti-sigma factor antagonist [Bacillota bacterium]